MKLIQYDNNTFTCTEEEVNINYLLSLGFTIEEIEEGVMDHQILEVEREQGMRPWEEEDY